MSGIEVRKALVSVYDKTGLDEFVRGLHAAGVAIVSSGGTAAAIVKAGVPVQLVSDVTASPEMLGGRVKTLHPRIHGGILADMGRSDHRDDLAEQGIDPFQLVVSNLYPFQETVSRPDVGEAEIIEQIDIGGPAMVRAAAKNHAWVGVVTSPDQYDEVLAAIRAGGLDDDLRRKLARAAFFHTASYDAAIVNWLEADTLPERIVVALERADILRYGENPHQAGARYREEGSTSWWDGVIQHEGLPLSYLNIYDAGAAWEMVHDLSGPERRPSVVIVKHANPCGASVASDLATAYQHAYECDPRSAFGGIVAFSHPVDLASVERVEAAAQADVVIAPGFDEGVVERIRARRKNTRVLEAPPPTSDRLHIRQTGGGWLVQDRYAFVSDPSEWTVVTDREPTHGELADAALAWRVCGHVSSNAIVLAKDGTAWGIGAGQQNRVESGELAVAKAAGRAGGGALASDAFFPFPDGVEVAARAGAAVVVQPGGAMRDAAVIERANELGLAMLFTGERQFRH